MNTPIYDIYEVKSFAFCTKTYYFTFFAFALLLQDSRNLKKQLCWLRHPPPPKKQNQDPCVSDVSGALLAADEG